jgi:hypothetical protein
LQKTEVNRASFRNRLLYLTVRERKVFNRKKGKKGKRKQNKAIFTFAFYFRPQPFLLELLDDQ